MMRFLLFLSLFGVLYAYVGYGASLLLVSLSEDGWCGKSLFIQRLLSSLLPITKRLRWTTRSAIP